MKTDDDAKYRAALVGIGFIYEDYSGPLKPEWIEIAKTLIAERQDKRSGDASNGGVGVNLDL